MFVLLRRYVDDTVTFIKIESVEYLLSIVNNYLEHPKIKFTYEMEVVSKLA